MNTATSSEPSTSPTAGGTTTRTRFSRWTIAPSKSASASPSPKTHTPNPCKATAPTGRRTYEVLNLSPKSSLPEVTTLVRFGEAESALAELHHAIAVLHDTSRELPYEDVTATGAIGPQSYRRLVEHVRTLYRKDDLSA